MPVSATPSLATWRPERLQDFAVIIDYADASSRPREAARFDVANGQHPHISARPWI
jgi:hypothetical protein